jgi:hypothetical protein
VDSGDWFSGTMFKMIGMSYLTQETPELEFFNYLNYDAVGLGNHGKIFFSLNFSRIRRTPRQSRPNDQKIKQNPKHACSNFNFKHGSFFFFF